MGYLYIIRAIGTKHYKIGISNKVEERLQGLQTGSQFQLEIIKKFKCINKALIERKIHIYLKNKKMRGEWFKLSEDDLCDCIEQVNKLVSETDKNNNDTKSDIVSTDKANIVPIINDKQITDKFPKKFNCKICDYDTDDKSNYNKHLKSEAHNKLVEPDNKAINLKEFKCDECGKKFVHASSFSRHKNYRCNNSTDIIKKELEELKQMILNPDPKIKELKAENKLIKKQLEEINKSKTYKISITNYIE
jgi:hypothetical protein